MGGKFRREETYVYLRLIHADVWQKPTQHCKTIILQLKIKKEKFGDVEKGKKKNMKHVRPNEFMCLGKAAKPGAGGDAIQS